MALDLGVLVLSLILASVILVLVWALSLARSSPPKESSPVKNVAKVNTKQPKTAGAKGSKKKATLSAKESKADFTHSWLLTTLKGHTGPVLDMDFSADGKYLVSCCEDDVFTANKPTIENWTPSETDSGSILSRRQKKNRSKRILTKKKEKQQKRNEANSQLHRATPSKYYNRLKMSNVELYRYLLKYVLTEDQLLNLGYPVESALYPGKAIIYKAQDAQVTYYRSDLRNFFQHKRGGFEMAEHLYGSDQAQFCTGQHPPLSPSLEKRCVRCGKGFFVTLDGEYLTEESCTYHWGRWKPLDNDRFGYSCCERSENDLGCSVNKLHVWTGVNSGMNGPLNDYIRTKKLRHPQYNVYALDCEMCYTGKGLELCKLTVVGIDGCLVYETLVKPHRSIVDYNTRFSGLNVNNLGKATKRLRDVQNDLMGFINGETILIGHGLENDLRALGLLHSNVIDTAVLFPHYYGLPFRRSLKSLVSAHLQREIQTRLDGHDSFEDARACVELVLWKVCCELRRKSEHLP